MVTGLPRAAAALAASGHADGFARASLPPQHLWPELDAVPAQPTDAARFNCASVLLDGAVAAGAGPRMALYGALPPGLPGAAIGWTYHQLQQTVNQICQVLTADLGLVTGNRVLLRGANSPMMAACLLAVIKAGCIAVPTMPLLRGGELATVASKARVNAILCASALRADMAGIERLAPVCWFDDASAGAGAGGTGGAAGSPFAATSDAGAPALPPAARRLEQLMARHDGCFSAPDTAADDVCLISFTSGTTGVPKGTMHFHRDLLAICDAFPRSILDTRSDDIFIGTPPLAFTFGMGGLLLFPLRVGAAAVLLDRPAPEALLAAIARYRATLCFTVPTMYRQMTAQAASHDLSSLRASVSAGEALTLATRDQWQQATGLAMIDGIGSTEMLHIFISAAGAQIRRGAIGKPIPGYRACILDAAGQPLGPGQVGRLAVKGPTGCRYLDDARQADYVVDGWNLTGDAGAMDADGYFYYRARTDELIISAGYNIAGPEVEEAMLRHPAVADCGVIGRADGGRGQIVEAHVVLRPGFAASAALASGLQDFVKGQIAPYKYPRAVKFLRRLPRTESGKLQRYKLRQGDSA